MSRYFITMDDAIKLCIYCSENMIGGEIFISKMESFKIIDLAKALSEKNNFKMRIIGLKPGEKLYEELITEEETSRTILIDNHYDVYIYNIMVKYINERIAYEKTKEDYSIVY